MDKEDRWEIWNTTLGLVAVLPIDDTDKHEELSRTCKCNPKIEYIGDGKMLIIHNAFDNRQFEEQIKEILKWKSY